MAIRFRSRFLHATVYDLIRARLGELGWTLGAANTAQRINFDTDPVKIIDYQPAERDERINVNTVAVTLGDVPADVEQELGAGVGGLNSVTYPIFLDVYMQETALTVALCDDLRDIVTDLVFPLEDKINGGFVPDVLVHVEDVIGPERPPSSSQSNEGFKRSWRVVHFDASLYFNSSAG